MDGIERILLKKRDVLTIRHAGARVQDLPKLIGEGFASLSAYVERNGGKLAEAPFVAFHGFSEDLRLDETDMTLEICFPLVAPIAGSGTIQASELPGTEAIRLHYRGNYDAGMTAVYETMLQKIQELGGEFLGVSYESYLTGPETPLDEQETVITIPYRSQ